MPISFPLNEGSVVVANGSRDDALVNHRELRAGFGDRAFPSSVTDEQLDVVIDAYGGSAVGALDETQVQQAITDGVLTEGSDGKMRVDFTQSEVAPALARAIVALGSNDDPLVNHTELRNGLAQLGFLVPMTNRMADVLIKAYAGDTATAINATDLALAINGGALNVVDGAVVLDFRSAGMAESLARIIVDDGSRDDALVNGGELINGLRAVGFDPRIDSNALNELISRGGNTALDVQGLTDAINQGALAVDGGGEMVAQAVPVYANPIDPTLPFADQVRGTVAQPMDRELGMIAEAVYDPSKTTVGNWTRISNAELRTLGIDPALVQDDSTSFKAGLYRNEAGQVTLAFAGTEGITAGKDWWTNAKQGLGFDAKQYREAVELGAQAKLAFGENLVVTGHSLGGGLAATVSLVHDIPAVTFNAAGVNDATLRRNGLDPEAAREQADDGLIRRYVVEGEFLNYGQDHLPVPNAPGHLISLQDPHPLPAWQENLPSPFNQLFRIPHSIKLHDMSQVFDAMTSTPPWPTQPAPADAPVIETALLPGWQPYAPSGWGGDVLPGGGRYEWPAETA